MTIEESTKSHTFPLVSYLSSWTKRMEMLVPPLPWDRPIRRENHGPLVILLHSTRLEFFQATDITSPQSAS